MRIEKIFFVLLFCFVASLSQASPLKSIQGLASPPPPAKPVEPPPHARGARWIDFHGQDRPWKSIQTNPQLYSELVLLVQKAIVNTFEGGLGLPSLSPLFKQPQAVFVTAKKNDEIRGCMGTLYPRQATLAEEIMSNLKLAFQQDPWHVPIRRDELEGMEIFVTSLGRLKLVQNLHSLNPARDAVLLRYGSKEAIALPGEAKTLRYLISFLKTKAGIKKKEPYRLYRLSTETVSVKIEDTSFLPEK